MLGAIYIGLSGMDTYQKGLQTISNNVANLNSNGFKQTALSFADLFDGGQSPLLGDSAGDGGDGVTIGSSPTDFSQGTLNPTNNDLDLGIQGNGFLVVLDKDGKTFYARTGSFSVDKDGFISDPSSGARLAVLDPTGKPVAINLNSKQTSAPVATTKITFTGNISSNNGAANNATTVSNVTVFDSTGATHVWTVNFADSTAAGALPGQMDVTVKDENGNTVGTVQELKFDGNAVDSASATPTITFTPTSGDPMTITLDFSQVTSFSSGTSETIATGTIDGNASGTLSTVTVDDSGNLLLTYTNQKTQTDGAVAMATFRDLQQLARRSDGLFANTGNEQPHLSASNTDGAGVLTPKTLEASNVDLSSEFGELILVQRGFQACSQVVSVSNDMIQQLFAIRGQ